MKPKLLDLCCKAGGCSKGYSNAGFDVYGVDIEPQPNYVHKGKFFCAHAIDFVIKYAHLFDAIHASPPCQEHTTITSIHKATGKEYVDIIPLIRDILEKSKKPYVMENVRTAPIRGDIVLRGDMFGLKVLRERKFEIGNWWCMNPSMPQKVGSVRKGDYACIVGNGSYTQSRKDAIPKFKMQSVIETWAYALGIDWKMRDTELSNAIPPAYTQWIGEQLMQYLKR